VGYVSRVIKFEVHVTSRTAGLLVLRKGTRESDLPRELLDERAQHLVVTPPRMEGTDEPLIGDHLWVT
jgi:hypothetical protein